MEKESSELELHLFGDELGVQELFPSRLVGGSDDDIEIAAIGTGCFAMSNAAMKDPDWRFRFNPAGEF